MAIPMETRLTISCLQCDWSVETTQAHADRHEQHAIEIVQRLMVYGTSYVEPTPSPKDARAAAGRRDSGIQTGFLGRTRRLGRRRHLSVNGWPRPREPATFRSAT